MFYAASEIIFWILLAAVIGGGIGYGLSEAKSLRLDKRLNDGKAHAPMERELAIAWDTIEDLNRRLQVAHETIRGTDGVAAGEDSEELAAADREATDDSTEDAEAMPAEADNGIVGARLSERVASASAAANQTPKSKVSD